MFLQYLDVPGLLQIQFCTLRFKEKNLSDYIEKNILNVGLHSNDYESFSFNLGMTDSTKLCSLVLVLMMLTFTQDHRFRRKTELQRLFCLEVLV